VVLGLGSVVLRLWRGERIDFVVVLPIVLGLIAIGLSGRLRRS
jgi:hypothetical protein